MEKVNVSSILASFATMKSLFDNRTYRNSYQLLAEFISYIIVSNKLRSISAVEMRNRLQESFGFEIPEAIVKTSIRSLDYITSEHNQFIVNSAKLDADPIFEEKRLEAENVNTDIIDMLIAFVMEKEPSKTILPEALTQAFVAFLIDDEPKSGSRYAELISQFILENEDNEKIQAALTSIREGSILYIGLNYNINETGSIRKTLTLYLGTEVLFSLYGLNGEIHKRLAHDLYDQIKLANSSDKKIFLRYFAETKKEIDDFFASAESIVAGMNALNDTTVAMKAIINGCDAVSDVMVKKADFYHILQYSYGIKEDDITDYYSENNNVYNLETLATDETLFDSVKLVSHINKLKKGCVFSSNIDAEYLFVTNSRNTISVSKKQSEQDKNTHSLEFVNDYAVTVEKITNLLWYKLGNGFGRKDYPCNVNAILKARTLLASHISQNVSKLYAETRTKYKAGEITKDQLAARIITLRCKTIIPDDLDSDTIEKSLDFSTEFLSRFEEEVLQNKTALEEKEKFLQTIENSNQRMQSEKNTVIAQKDQLLMTMNEQKRNLETELDEYRSKEQAKAAKREKLKRIMRFIWSLVWKILIVTGVIVVTILICRRINSVIVSKFCTVVDGIGFLVIGWKILKNEIVKHFPKKK